MIIYSSSPSNGFIIVHDEKVVAHSWHSRSGSVKSHVKFSLGSCKVICGDLSARVSPESVLYHIGYQSCFPRSARRVTSLQTLIDICAEKNSDFSRSPDIYNRLFLALPPMTSLDRQSMTPEDIVRLCDDAVAEKRQPTEKEAINLLAATLSSQLVILDRIINKGHCAVFADITSTDMWNIISQRDSIVDALMVAEAAVGAPSPANR